MTQPQRSDSLRTQALLIETAEQLFAERGLESVSLSEINRAAGQRNKSALHYHFGSRDGLLLALLNRHRSALDARRVELIAAAGPIETMTLAQAVSILVRPLAEKLDDTSGSNFIRIMAQLTANPNNSLHSWLYDELPSALISLQPVFGRQASYEAGPLRRRRIQLMNGTMFHTLLLQATAERLDPAEALNRDVYIDDLELCLCAISSAPAVPDVNQRTTGISVSI